MVVEHTTWTARCEGCSDMYGDEFDSKAEALAFIEEFPLCSGCDGSEDAE